MDKQEGRKNHNADHFPDPPFNERIEILRRRYFSIIDKTDTEITARTVDAIAEVRISQRVSRRFSIAGRYGPAGVKGKHRFRTWLKE
jgi:hypothetical protein